MDTATSLVLVIAAISIPIAASRIAYWASESQRHKAAAKASEMEYFKAPPKEVTIYGRPCPRCQTLTVHAPGIGFFCPNPSCDAVDDLQETL